METGLTDDQKKLYATISEEAAEVIQIVSKILRFGEYSCHPETGERNDERLEEELTDLVATIELAKEYGLLVPDMSNLNLEAINKKKAKVARYNELPYPELESKDWWS